MLITNIYVYLLYDITLGIARYLKENQSNFHLVITYTVHLKSKTILHDQIIFHNYFKTPFNYFQVCVSKIAFKIDRFDRIANLWTVGNEMSLYCCLNQIKLKRSFI